MRRIARRNTTGGTRPLHERESRERISPAHNTRIRFIRQIIILRILTVHVEGLSLRWINTTTKNPVITATKGIMSTSILMWTTKAVEQGLPGTIIRKDTNRANVIDVQRTDVTSHFIPSRTIRKIIVEVREALRSTVIATYSIAEVATEMMQHIRRATNIAMRISTFTNSRLPENERL